MKKCPYCQGEVADDATSCNHCGRGRVGSKPVAVASASVVSDRCPHCGAGINYTDRICPICGKDTAGRHLLAATADEPTRVTVVTKPHGVAYILQKMVWGFALLAMGVLAALSLATFSVQTGAPQQAAAAAQSCFLMITVYVIARALDALLR